MSRLVGHCFIHTVWSWDVFNTLHAQISHMELLLQWSNHIAMCLHNAGHSFCIQSKFPELLSIPLN